MKASVGAQEVAPWTSRLEEDGPPPSPLSDGPSDSEVDDGSGFNDDAWEDAEPDEEQVAVLSFFDDKTFSDLESMLAYCREKSGFDFKATRQTLGLDFHGTVKLCNFVRGCARDGRPLPHTITHEHLASDDLLQPVVADDAVIFLLDEVLNEHVTGSATGPATESELEKLRAEKAQLEADLSAMQKKFSEFKLFVEEALDRRWGDDSTQSAAPTNKVSGGSGQDDKEYWESYAGRDIHETMLKDTVRTQAYRDFVYENKDVFKGKVVLDIGCGTGILSLFCARAGAKMVIAVDNSAIISKARENVFNNGLSHVITCLSGRIEDVTLPTAKVDVIISEWMGYCLLYEAMLPSIIWARDKYLEPDGLLVPSHATIWAAPVSDDNFLDDNISFWRDVYGFDMSSMQEGIYDDVRVHHMAESALCGKAVLVSTLPLHRTTVADLTFQTPWSTSLSRDVDLVSGFVLWFDIFFERDGNGGEAPGTKTASDWVDGKKGAVAFTTGPHGHETHWKQGFLVATPVAGHSPSKAGTEIKGHVSFSSPEGDARGLKISMDWSTAAPDTSRTQTWLLR